MNIRTLFFVLISTIGWAEKALPDRAHAISVDVAAIPFGELSLIYQHKTMPFLNLVFPLDIQSLSVFLLPQEVITVQRTTFGFGILPDLTVASGIGVKLHYSGWYVEPLLGLGYARIDYPSRYGTRHLLMIKPALLLGYHTTFPFGMYLDVGIGLAGRIFIPTADANALIQPNGRIAVGYAW